MSSRLAQHFPPAAVDPALRQQALAGGSLDTALLELGLIGESELLELLGKVTGLTPIDLRDYEPNPEVAHLIPAKLADRLRVVPLSVEGNLVHVACTEPVPQAELNEVGFLLGKELALWISLEVRIRDWVSALYGLRPGPRYEALLAHLGGPPPSVPVPVDEPALADALTREMVESVARAVTEEPLILLGRDDAELPATPTLTPEPVAAPPAPAAVQEIVPDWSLDEARTALKAASQDREAIKDVTLRYARRTFDFACAFAVIQGAAVGWDARGENADPDAVARISFPLDVPSIFRTAVLGHTGYAGPPPQDELTQTVLGQLGRAPRTVFVFPVELKHRVVALLYGDCGARPMSQRGAADFRLFCEALPHAFGELLLLRKQRRVEPRPEETIELAPTADGLGWTPTAEVVPSGLGRAAAHPALWQPSYERPPADFEPLLERLTGPDPAQRARAMVELSRSPESSARVLVAHFPGPTAWSRSPVTELPPADELGPIPAALSRLGRPAAQALSSLLDSDDPEVRYFALLCAGSLPYAEVVPGVLRGLFDLEPEISSAARATAAVIKRLPRFDAAMRGLRQELTTLEPLRRSLAARALGALHDRESVEGLIGLSGSQDPLCSSAAAEALQEITGAAFGASARAWSAWWAENRGRRRSEWLLAALSARNEALRTSAIEELAAAIGDSLGYVPDADAPAREQAIARWEKILWSDPRLRAVD